MADRFNRANFLQGSVSPVAGGGVRVPLDDPQNKVLAQGLGTLASRLDAFKSTAFKVETLLQKRKWKPHHGSDNKLRLLAIPLV